MAAPAVDYAALAKQAGAVSSTPPAVDYAALAKQAGATSSTSSPSGDRQPDNSFGNIALSFGRGVVHTLTPSTDDMREFQDRFQKGDWLGAFKVAAKASLKSTPAAMIPGIVRSGVDQGRQAVQSAREGDYSEAVGHGVAALLPGVGPVVARGSEKLGQGVGSGDYGQAAEGAGEITAAVAPMGVKMLPKSVPVIPRMGTSLDASEQAAVDFGRAHDIPIDAATATGSPAIRNMQTAAGNLPGVAAAAKRARLAQSTALEQTGTRLAEQVTPNPADAETAGEGVRTSLTKRTADLNAQASDAYTTLRDIESQPANLKSVQVGSKTVDTGVIGPDGRPISRTQPVTKDIPLPADMRPAKAALQPLYDELKQQMPIAQQQASPALKALENVVNGEDYLPLSTADQNLSAIKQIVRDAPNAKVAYLAKQALAKVSGAIDQAAQQAGPQAVQALRDGRAMTRAKYATQETLDSLKMEPVQLANQLTRAKDQSINLLRDVQSKAPDAMPVLGRSVLDGLLQKAFAEAGTDKPGTVLTQWRNLGQQTKQILFKDPKLIGDLDSFFTLAKKVAENPNPSGTAHVGMYVATLASDGTLLVTRPDIAVPYIIGRTALARMLMTPRGAAVLSQGVRIPIAKSALSQIAAAQILKAAGDDAKAANDQAPAGSR